MHTRREILIRSLVGAGTLLLPGVLASTGCAHRRSANDRIQIAQIGCGRMGFSDCSSLLAINEARVVALCDVDAKRLNEAHRQVVNYYRQRGEQDVSCKTYDDYRHIMADQTIDAVVISTPDHWHALPVAAALLAGKAVYVQKPLALTMAETRMLKQLAHDRGGIVQIGSQQRSGRYFRLACQLVRSGAVGRLHTVRIGLNHDAAGPELMPQAVPANLDYDRWLGPAHAPSDFPYIEKRVHSQQDLNERPGWLRVEDFCLGMITGWGSHHIDIAHLAMGCELGGPTAITAKAEFPRKGIHNVHGQYHAELAYPGEVTVILDHSYPNGIRFEGSDGWIFVQRGEGSGTGRPLQASKPELLKTPLPPSMNHYEDWIVAIRANRQPIAPLDQGAHTGAACIAIWVGMKLGRPVRFDPVAMEFPGDDDANRLCVRSARSGYDLEALIRNG